MKEHAIIGFNHGVLGLAENPALGPGFFRQNTSGYALGVLTPKASPSGWVFSQAQHPMIKTYINGPVCPTRLTQMTKDFAMRHDESYVEWNDISIKWYQFVTNCPYHQTIYSKHNICSFEFLLRFHDSFAGRSVNPDHVVVENWHIIYFFINFT